MLPVSVERSLTTTVTFVRSMSAERLWKSLASSSICRKTFSSDAGARDWPCVTNRLADATKITAHKATVALRFFQMNKSPPKKTKLSSLYGPS